jgi:VanZ family protein
MLTMRNHAWQTTMIRLFLACYWLALFVATHLPTAMVPLPGGISDKMPHLVAYAILAAAFALAWRVTAGPLSWRQLFAAWILIVAYGAIDELSQTPVGRDANLRDWLADATGAAIGLAIFQIWNAGLAPDTDT